MSSLKKQVYRIVEQIPSGKVVTYGQIAAMIHSPDHSRSAPGQNYAHSGSVARSVGNALQQNKSSDVPCHRVVDRNGRLAPNFGFGGYLEQKRRLEVEGVKFVDEMHVDLVKSLWQGKF